MHALQQCAAAATGDGILVFIGGGIGAAARELLMLVVADLPGGFPMPIFIANMTAGFSHGGGRRESTSAPSAIDGLVNGRGEFKTKEEFDSYGRRAASSWFASFRCDLAP
jgi:hypothetical protein